MSPNSHGFIFPTASHSLPIRAPIDGIDLILMPWKVLRELSSSDVPDFQSCILGRTDEQSRVGGEGTLVDGSDMAT